MSFRLSRQEYSELYGPTKGDKIHLADTGLILEIEEDYTAQAYGEEITTGGGKSGRDGMGKKPGITSEEGCLDKCFTNCIIIDAVLGIIKADIGVKDGRIVGIGKAGNPDIMDITPGLVIGGNTEVVSTAGQIVTAGGIDVHVHFESPDQAWEALGNGLTTMIGGGSGAQYLSIEVPGPFHLHSMIMAHEDLPVNAGFLGRGNSSLPGVIREQALNGAIGMKIHEDYGATPEVIRCCLDVADELDFQVQIHTDSLNESGFVDTTLDAIGDRTMHAYHAEGAGGGHAPDVMVVCGKDNIIPSSTNPTNPYTVNTIDEHLDMIMTVHCLNPNLPEDVAFADSRIRGETIAAEDVFHDMGAISIMGSDSQGMGRVGESIQRTWQLASKMKMQRGPLPEDKEGNDNERILRYIAKYTKNAALVYGIDEYVGSLEPGRLADIVVWDSVFFGTKPTWVFKGGQIIYSPTGDLNASIEVAEPMLFRKQYAALGSAINKNSMIFVTQAAIDDGLSAKVPYSADKLVPIKNTRNLRKSDMLRNSYCPNITIDPETYKVFIDGEHITCEPILDVSLGQKYYFR